MELLNRLSKFATSNNIAFHNAFTNEILTFGELELLSNKLSGYLSCNFPDKMPIVVFGHKSPLMIAAFIGCVKAGHPYCPVDTSMPEERIRDILDVSGAKLIIKIEDVDIEGVDSLSLVDVINFANCPNMDRSKWVSGDDVFYIIFTSGSTGKPKGVQITANCLDNY